MTSLLKADALISTTIPDLTTIERMCLRSIVVKKKMSFEVFFSEEIVSAAQPIAGLITTPINFYGYIIVNHDEKKIQLFAECYDSIPIEVPQVIADELYYTICIVNNLEKYEGTEIITNQVVEFNTSNTDIEYADRPFSLVPGRVTISFSTAMIQEIKEWL